MPVLTGSLHPTGAMSAALMARQVDQLRATIARRLRRAGVQLPDAELDVVAESLMADAVRLSLNWLDIEREAAH